jgi:hypothetical protein
MTGVHFARAPVYMTGIDLHIALDSIHEVMEQPMTTRHKADVQLELLFVIAEALVELVISDDAGEYPESR